MPVPTAEQLAEARAGQMTLSGSHTVGVPDGGRGLWGTGWSLEHGDVRVPHFIGLHALQVLPLLWLALRRTRWSETKRARLIRTAAGSYASLFAVLLWQALRGESVVAPGALTIGVLTVWAASTLALAVHYAAEGTDAEIDAFLGLPAAIDLPTSLVKREQEKSASASGAVSA
jgi:hypothetical protein